jgi:hypothetical protein
MLSKKIWCVVWRSYWVFPDSRNSPSHGTLQDRFELESLSNSKEFQNKRNNSETSLNSHWKMSTSPSRMGEMYNSTWQNNSFFCFQLIDSLSRFDLSILFSVRNTSSVTVTFLLWQFCLFGMWIVKEQNDSNYFQYFEAVPFVTNNEIDIGNLAYLVDVYPQLIVRHH